MNFEIAILIILFLVSFALLLVNFDLSVFVMLVLSVLLHKELFSILKWDILPIRVFMLAFLCYSILLFFRANRTFKEKITFFRDPFIVLLVLMWVVSGVSIYFSKNLYASLSLYGFFTCVVGAVLVLYRYFKESVERSLGTLKVYMYIVVALCLFCVFQAVYYLKTGNIIGALWNIPGNIPRLGATFWDVNHFGALISVLLLPLVTFILTTKGRRRFLYLAMLVLMTGILFLTNSRSAWILAGVSSLSFVSLYLFRKLGKRGLMGLSFVLLLLVAGFYWEYSDKASPFRKFIKDQFHYRIDSFDSHIMLLKGSYQIFEKYPFLGGGYGSFFEHFSQTDIAAEYFGRDPAALNTRVPAHTIWGESLSETGIVGFILLVSFVLLLLIVPLYTALRSNDRFKMLLSSAIFSSFLGWFIAGIFYSYKSEFFWIIIVLYFSISVGMLEKGMKVKDILTRVTRSKLPFLVILLTSFVLIFSGLGRNHLIPWDEAIYAKIAKNMNETEEYVTQYWDPGKPWYEKPPLYMWLASLSLRVFPDSEFAVRFPSALLGFSSVILLYIFAKRLYGKTAAFFSALSLLTTFHFLYYSRASMLDVSVTFFIFLSLYFYFLTLEKKKLIYWVLSGASCGLAVMTKGVIGLLPLFFILGFELVTLLVERKFKIRTYLIRLVAFLLPCLAVFMPWHLAMYARFGDSFLDTYIGYHVFARALSEIEDKGKPFFWYQEVMRTSMRIWFVAFIFALPFMAWSFFKERSKAHLFFLLWVVFVFLFFSISRSKLVWYIMPIYPITSIMIGYSISRAWNMLALKFKVFSDPVFRFLLTFGIFVFALFYLFLNRELVYVSDLTGAQAELMLLKDQEFGKDTEVYLDRMELPLAYFYLDSPFTVVDYQPLKKVMDSSSGERQVIFIAKESRYRSYKDLHPEIVLVAQNKEWVLAYLPLIPDSSVY